MEDKFVTIRTFNSPNEAYILQGRLESEGIDCFIEDDNLISINPLLSNAIGGVKLNVSEKDSERAVKISQEIDTEFNESIKNDTDDEGWEELRNKSRKRTKNIQRFVWGFISLFIISIIVIIMIEPSNSPEVDPYSIAPETTNLEQDIPIASEWLVSYFKRDKITLDYSLESIKKLDTFIEENSENGSPKKNSKLSNIARYKLFAMGSYVEQVMIKNSSGSKLLTDEKDPDGDFNFSIMTKDSVQIWPAQKVMKRLYNGSEDELYFYATLMFEKYLGKESKEL